MIFLHDAGSNGQADVENRSSSAGTLALVVIALPVLASSVEIFLCKRRESIYRRLPRMRPILATWAGCHINKQTNLTFAEVLLQLSNMEQGTCHCTFLSSGFCNSHIISCSPRPPGDTSLPRHNAKQNLQRDTEVMIGNSTSVKTEFRRS